MAKGFYLVRVGSDSRPATKEDLDDIMEKLKAFQPDTDFLVTHHDVTIQWVSDDPLFLNPFTQTSNDNQVIGCDCGGCCDHEGVEW